MIYLYITNNADIAREIDAADVWVWVDLETIGKRERQKGRDTIISAHSVDDIKKVKSVLQESKVVVRCNPIGVHSADEIDAILENEPDIIMLPYFKSETEVRSFLDLVSGRAATMLLVETIGAEKNLRNILSSNEVDYVHIGLNDLHIEYEMQFMFELYSEGVIERIARELQSHGVKYGFGGIGNFESNLKPDPRLVLSEHKRLGSSLVILSRSFLNSSDYSDYEKLGVDFRDRLSAVREHFMSLSGENNLRRYKHQLDFEVQEVVRSFK